MIPYTSKPPSKWLRPLLTLALLLVLVVHLTAQVAIPYIANGTFTPPTGVTSVTVECWGGGGHGGTWSGSNGAGGGGGGGAYARSVLTVTPGTPYTVTVGAGSSTAAAGGDSWFSSAGTVMAKGGSSVANNTTTGAAGGLASASIGTFKFNGGTGGTSATNSGGGGSSAGIAAVGGNGAVTAGGTAPTGGGDGGDGVTTNVAGNDGIFPGGAGSGARRTSGTKAGGDGANGYVVVSYTYTDGTCLNAVTGTGIPDNACATSPLLVTIPVSGLPTTLGTAAGNAKLNSLEFIINHTYNSDLRITLTSPNGTTRNIVTSRFGTGDNLGNPATCPSSPLVIQDGGTALTNTNTSNVTGTYAPEQALSGFTGNPNGDWTLSICDNGAADVGNFRYLSLDFCTVQSTATVGGTQTICANGTTGSLGGNTPTSGTGAWSVVSGGTGTFSNAASGTSTFTHTGGTGPIVVRWSISGAGLCATSSANVTLTINQTPTTASVGGAQVICSGGTTTALGGNTPSSGIGAWSIIGGGAGSFSPSAAIPNATFTHTSGTVTALRWTISSGSCTASTADVAMTIDNPLAAPTGIIGSANVCSGATGLSFSVATVTGASNYTWTVPSGWSITSGQGTLSMLATAGSTGGDITVVASNSCGSTNPSSTSNLVLVPVAATNNTGYVNGTTKNSDAINCSTTLFGYAKFPLTGLPNGAIVTAANLALTHNSSPTVSGAVNNINALGNTDPVSATGAALSAAITGGAAYSSVAWTNTGVISLNLNATAVSDIQARIASPSWLGVGMERGGTATYNFFGYSAGANAPKLTLTHTRPRFTTVTVTAAPTTANAGSTLSTCVSSGTATMAANTAVVGTGAWSFISGPATPGISTPASPTTNITGMTTAGAYVFRWTISNSPCTPSTSDVTINSFALPSSANAGSNQNICTSVGSATMAANTPSIGAGAWSQISGPITATIASSAPNTGISGMTTTGTYVFRWTITNGTCATSTSNVSIVANAPPTTAVAGSPQSICTSVGTAVMAANAPSVGTGSWSQISGPSTASIVSASSRTTTINGLTSVGNYVFRWTISSTGCSASTDDVTISVVGVPTTASAGSPQTICASSGSVTLTGNTPTVGVGTWTQLSGPVTGNITDSSLPGTSVTGLTTAGNYTFRWRITSSPCTASSSNVIITVAPAPTVADAGIDQDVCVSPGMATMAANTALVGTGTWSQISGPATASIANTSDELTDISGFNLVGAYVFRWSIDVSGCPSSTSDVTVNVHGSPSTADAGSDIPACITTGVATMGAASPTVGVGVWTQVSGPVTATITDDADPSTQITGMTTAGVYTFRWTISNSPCSDSMDDINITSGLCVYYSRGSGDVNDGVWSDTPGGVADFASFSSFTNVVIQSGDVITNTSDLNVGDLTVEAGATLVINGATTVNTFGDVVLGGTLSAAANSGFALRGSSANTLTTTGSPSFFDLNVDNAAGITLSGSAIVRNTLLLENGAFNAGTAQLTFASNATSTARLGPVDPSASYVGDLIMQRYIPAGATNWRLLGSSVSGQTVNNWKDDFFTAGFPGSHSPGFSNPVGSGIVWPSVRWYNESNGGPQVIDGLTGATSISQPLVAGQGFAAWCGTGLTTTTAFIVDVTGNPNVAQTPITLPMTYTSTGVSNTDGWNMVSNPLPSPIAFNMINRGSDVEDFITYFDPATGNNATWDIGLGIGLNNGTNTIQSSQGFWLKAVGSNVTTTVSESAKVAGNTGGFFGGDQIQLNNMVRLRLTSAMNQYSDEALVIFSEGSPETDGEDVPKFVFAHPDAPQIATVGDAGEMIAINAYGEYTTNISIPVTVDVAVNGMYTITATGLDMVGLSCLQLEDLATNTSTPLVEGASYSFTALGSDDANNARFILHASAPLQFATTSATCAGRDDGAASVEVGSGPVDIVWMDEEGVVLLEQNNVQAGTSDIHALEAGSYSVQVTSNAGCGNLHTSFEIQQPSALEVEADAMPTSCPATEDGTIDLMVLGGVAPYTYLWSNGATDSAIEVAAGTYTVEVSDANGCSFAPQEYVVSAGEGPEAGISVESTTVMVNDEVTFFVLTATDITNSWDFGDGMTSDELEPTHSYGQPGEYTITLTVDDGTCTSTTTLVLTVESTTGLPTIVGQSLNAWISGDMIVVDHNFNDNEPVLVRVLSTNGQLVQTHRFAGQPARLTLPTADLATGIWLVRVSSGNSVRTFSLPVLH